MEFEFAYEIAIGFAKQTVWSLGVEKNSVYFLTENMMSNFND